MYKILAADDEGIVLDSLKFIIEKEYGDQCVLQTAKTGRSAIELAESFRPDIAIMDIQMPGINGIDAMREMRAENKNTVFIVMSAYDKFDYAQQAMQLGVKEYITKPMDRKKVIEAINRAMTQVSIDKEKRSNDLLVREKLETVIPILENGMIYNILLSDQYQDLENYKNLLDIPSDYGFVIVLISGEKQEGIHLTNAIGTGVVLQKNYNEIRNDIKGAFSESIVGGTMANKIAVFVPTLNERLEYNERIQLIEKCRTLVKNMKNKYGVMLRMGIGPICALNDMNTSYKDSLKALRLSTGSIAHADDLQVSVEYDKDYPMNLENNLFSAVGRGDVSAAADYAERFFDWMVERDSEDLMSLRLKVLEFVIRAETAVYREGGTTYHYDSRKDYLPTVMAASDVDSIKEWYLSKISESTRDIVDHLDKSDKDITIAREYIEKNYTSNISLDDVSRIVNISPYYFSKVFKEETGENFIDYLTNLRINRAKELLLEGTLSMKEICNEIGYSDPNYFSRTFKKNVGVSPTEYKEGKGQ